MIFVYKTTNKVNGKFYYGVHKTKNINDSYLGSGKRLLDAIKHYGKDKFQREIISIHEDYDSALKEEARLVELVLGDSDCYNLCSGGGMPPKWDGENHPMFGKKRPDMSKLMRDKNPMRGSGRKSNIKKVVVKDTLGNIIKVSLSDPRLLSKELIPVNKGRKHSPEIKVKNPATFINLVCPYCNKVGNGIAMRRWHFDYCKYKQMEGSV